MNHIYYFYGEESRSHDFLFYVLNRYYGIAASEKDLKKSPCGKLYLEGSAIHFNLSHSKDVVALAVGNSPVGLDVEKMRDKNFSKVANVYFGNSATDAESFFTLWTKAESFVKYRAGTLLTDLKKIRIEGEKLFYDGAPADAPTATLKMKDFILSVTSQEEIADVIEVKDFI
jgi:holo-[acyl-carrier-protein] synthase